MAVQIAVALPLVLLVRLFSEFEPQVQIAGQQADITFALFSRPPPANS
jgi:hypothetical protein